MHLSGSSRILSYDNSCKLKSIGFGLLLTFAVVFQCWSAAFTTNWTGSVGSAQTGTIAVWTNGSVYYPSLGGIQALNPDGSQKWFGTFGEVISHSTVAVTPDGGMVAAGGNHVISYDSAGNQRWSKTIGFGFDHALALETDGTIYLGNRDGNIYALDSSGNQKWAFATGDQLFGGPPLIRGGPAVGKDGTIYCGSSDGRLYALNPNGTKQWDYMVGSPISMPPSIGGDGTIYVAGYNGVLVAVDSGGGKKWEFAGVVNGDPRWSPAIGSDGTVYYVCNAFVYSLNPFTGTKNWHYTDSSTWSTPVVLSDGSLYVVGSGNYLVHLNSNGTLRRQHNAVSSITYPPAVTTNGSVFYAVDGTAVSLDGGIGPADSPWPMFQRDPQRTGRTPPVPGADWIMPVDAMTFVAGQSVPLRVALVNLPTVDRVDFYANGVLLGNDTSGPYQWSWTAVGPGGATFIAVAISGSTSVTSPPVAVTVIASQPNLSPIAAMTLPTNNTTWIAGQTVSLMSTASDPDGIVVNVEFYDGASLVGTRDYPSFTQVISNVSAGLHQFRAVAVDNFGARSTSSVVNAFAVRKLWELASPNANFTFKAPATGPGDVTYAGAADVLYALNSNGQTNWAYALDTSGVGSAPVVGDDGTIYFGDSAGVLHAVAPNGTNRWKFSGSGQILATPAIGTNGVIYFSSFNGILYAIDSTGHKLWQTNTAGSASALGGDGTIYVAAGDGIHALNVDGSEKWNYPVNGAAMATPAIGASGTLFFGAANVGKFYALNSPCRPSWSLAYSGRRMNGSRARALANAGGPHTTCWGGTPSIRSKRVGRDPRPVSRPSSFG